MKKICLIVIVLTLLTGCVKGNINIEYTDNIAKMNVEVLFPKELLNNYNASMDDLKTILAKNGLDNWQYQELNQTKNRIEYLGFQLTAPTQINQMLMSFYQVNKKKHISTVEFDLKKINSSLNISELKDIDLNSLNDLESMGLELNLNIKMPGTIKETTFGKIKNNQVVINLIDLLKEKNLSKITITADNKKRIFPMNFLIIIALSLILYLILRKSK